MPHYIISHYFFLNVFKYIAYVFVNAIDNKSHCVFLIRSNLFTLELPFLMISKGQRAILEEQRVSILRNSYVLALLQSLTFANEEFLMKFLKFSSEVFFIVLMIVSPVVVVRRDQILILRAIICITFLFFFPV